MDLADGAAREAILRQELAPENRALDSVVPILRHLLASEGPRLVTDAILARVRGMLSDIAGQLLAAAAGRDPALRLAGAADMRQRDALAESLAGDALLLAHCHGLAMESQLAARIHQHHGIDPVLSPLLQELIASDEPVIAQLAMSVLAAQSRFIQSQQRMELPLGELPAELFLTVISEHGPQADAVRQLQAGYDEAAGRLGLLARLVSGLGRGAIAALSLDHAGPALFTTALAALAREPRVQAVLACQEGQGARLALTLRSADLSLEEIARQFALIDPAAGVPHNLAELSPERARLLLSAV